MKTQEEREYEKNEKLHKKLMKKIIKVSGPWDYQFGLDLLIEHIRMMKDFYEKILSNETNFKLCDKMIKEYEASIISTDDEKREIAEKLGLELEKIQDNVEFVEEGLNAQRAIFKYYSEEQHSEFYKKCEEARNNHWNNFIKLFSENIRNIWD